MTKKLLPVILIAILNFSLFAQEEDSALKLEFEKAKIIKKHTLKNAMMETITIDTTYILDHGKTTATYKHETQNIKMLNQKTESHTLIILKDGWRYTIDLIARTGKKMKDLAGEMYGDMSKKDAKKFAQNITDATGTDLKEVGTEKVAGVLCKVLVSNTNMGGFSTSAKMWNYKNYNLKLESESMGTKILEEAISFEEGIEISKLFFEIPTDIDISTLNLNY